MAYIINEHTSQPVIIEQDPSPVVFHPLPQPEVVQALPFQPVYVGQATPPVIVQPAPQPEVVQAPAPVVFRKSIKAYPTSVKCNLCQQQVITMTKPVNGILTWIIVTILFFCLIWPFCLIPFCCNSCKDIKHTCPNCQNVIHVHKRI